MAFNESQIGDIAEKILRCRSDVEKLERDGCWFYYEGGPDKLSDDCLFDSLYTDVKKGLLEFLFSDEGLRSPFSWNINVELAKLAAKDGWLVRERAEKFFPENIVDGWSSYFYHVAYFGSNPIYESKLHDLIVRWNEVVGGGYGYDGILMAAWFLKSRMIDSLLISQCANWLEYGTLDRADDILTSYGQFLRRWEQEPPLPGLEKLQMLYGREMGKINPVG